MMDPIGHLDRVPHSGHERGSSVPKRILIVDDEEDVRWLLATLLKEYGFEPVVACNGLEALEQVKMSAPEVILMDLRMPILDGMTVLKDIRASQPELPIIMITAYGDISSAVEAMKLGAYDYITKPFDNVKLVRAVVGALERRALERALRESHDLLRAAIEATTDAVFVKDLQGRYLIINTAGARLFGRSVEEIMGRCDSELFSANTARDIMQRDSWVIATGETQTYEETVEIAGVTRVYLSTKGLYRNHESKLLGLIGISRDITERVRAEDALKASEAKFRGLFENMLEGVYQAGPDDGILTANPAFARMLGYASAEELQAADATRLYVDREARRAFRRALEEAGEVRNLEVALRAKDGRTITALESARAVRDQNGRLLYYHGTLTDITERRQMEDELRQTQRMEVIGQLAGGIAHDFNNLLTVIVGYTDLMRAELEEGNPIRKDLDEVEKAARSAASLTQQLLAFGRRQMLQPVVLDLNHVVGKVESMLRPLIGETIELETILDPTLGGVLVDPGQIDQVLMNLVVNARDAMPEGGTITIATANVVLDSEFARRHVGAVPGRYVSLTIRDAGCGMTPDVLARVFEPFFTTKGPGKGTGLGLSTVFGLVKQSGGYITIESTPGVGTTVTTYLPTVDDPVESAAAGPRSMQTLEGTETILLVEDETGVRNLIRKMLERYGYTVLQARDAGDAIAIEKSYRGAIHLLVSDMIMPGLSGSDLAQRIVRRRPAIKVLFVSGYASREAIDLGVINQKVSFLQKPFRPGTLARKVRERLDGHVGQPGRESTSV